MPSIPISAMPNVTTFTGNELLPLVQALANVRTTLADLLVWIQATPVGTFPNNVEYLTAPDLVDGELIKSAGGVGVAATGLTNPAAGDLNAAGNVSVLGVVITAALRMALLDPNALLYMNGTDVATDVGIQRTAAGELTMNFLTAALGLSAGAGGFGVDSVGQTTTKNLVVNGGNATIDPTGRVDASDIHSLSGANFSGAVTNITVVDGIVIAAS